LITGSIVAVTLAAFKLVDKIAARSGNGIKPVNLPTDVKAAIFDTQRHATILVKQHAPEGGMERWKWPPELTNVIQAMAETQRTQCVLMERWDKGLEKHRDREETVLTEIRDGLRGLLKELR